MRSFRVPVIGFVAPSGSGKTMLLQKLVPVLTERGLRVGYLKHAHHSFDLDVPGKDSYQIREAGAKQTLLASKERWALQSQQTDRGEDPSLEEMLGKLDTDGLDLIMVEGFKHSAYPKIEIHRRAMGTPVLYPQDPDVIAVVTDDRLAGNDHPLKLSPDDPNAIADFVQNRMQAWSPDTAGLRAELVRYYQWLRRYGYNDSHSGNASVRVGDTFWVTPTGACADTLEPDDLIACPLGGPCPEGASLDAPLHGRVYRQQPGARAVLHSHGPYSVAMSLSGQDFRPVDFEGQYLFDHVPVLSVSYGDYLEKAPEAVAEALARHRVVMVQGHGVYAWGKTLDRAYKWTCSLELSAKIYVISRP
jgi:molybdopterin-guanine dinucleotide biosynthesis protein MobB